MKGAGLVMKIKDEHIIAGLFVLMTLLLTCSCHVFLSDVFSSYNQRTASAGVERLATGVFGLNTWLYTVMVFFILIVFSCCIVWCTRWLRVEQECR